MPITKALCATWCDDIEDCYAQVLEFTVLPRVGDIVVLGGAGHTVIAVVVHPVERDSDTDVEIYTRELDQDEYLEAINHPDRPSRLAPEDEPDLDDVPEPAADAPAAPEAPGPG